MFKRILVPTDGTELCMLALDTAVRLAQLSGGAIVGLHAVSQSDRALDPPDPDPGVVDPHREAWDHECAQQATDALGYVRRRALEAGVPVETVMTHASSPHEAIERVAREQGCDLIVLAAHARRGLRARLLGGEAEKLLAHGKVPLLIVR